MKHIIKIIAAIMAATIMCVTAHAEVAEKERTFNIWRNPYINMAKIVELVKMTYDEATCCVEHRTDGAMAYYSNEYYISETESYYAWRDEAADGTNVSWGVLYRNTDEHADVIMSCKYCGLFDENLRNAKYGSLLMW